jgi:hypothetical protein
MFSFMARSPSKRTSQPLERISKEENMTPEPPALASELVREDLKALYTLSNSDSSSMALSETRAQRKVRHVTSPLRIGKGILEPLVFTSSQKGSSSHIS